MRFDEGKYAQEYMKKLRGAHTLPDDLLERYAISLPATDQEIAAQLKAVRGYWNKTSQGSTHTAHAARMCRAEDERLKAEHGVRMERQAWWQSRQPVLDWPQVLRDLSAMAADQSPGPAIPASAAAVAHEVTARLLGQPALSEAEVSALGADPGDPGLIRLRRPDGGYQWPGFRFTAAGPAAVPAVVRRINELLDGRGDPIGAADWWLSRNGWLGDAPGRLLGTVPDHVLLEAAAALAGEV